MGGDNGLGKAGKKLSAYGYKRKGRRTVPGAIIHFRARPGLLSVTPGPRVARPLLQKSLEREVMSKWTTGYVPVPICSKVSNTSVLKISLYCRGMQRGTGENV